MTLNLPQNPRNHPRPSSGETRQRIENGRTLNVSTAYGVAYWHRCHQLPGVYHCRIHNAPLQESPLRIDRRRRSIFLLPRDYGIFTPNQKSPISNTPNTILSRLAVMSVNVLEQPLPKEYAPSQLKATYAHGLRDLGFLTRGGNVRCREFLKWISLSSLVTTLCSPPRKMPLQRLENPRPLATTLFSRNTELLSKVCEGRHKAPFVIRSPGNQDGIQDHRTRNQAWS